MTSFSKRILYPAVILMILFAAVSCSGWYSKTQVPEECRPLLYHEINRLDNSIDFLRTNLERSQKYLALKTLSSTSYDLVVLSIGSNSGILLATSLDRNVSVTFDRGEAIEIYLNILEGSEKFANETVLKTECAFTRTKDNIIKETVLVNPSNSNYTKSNHELNIYFGLNDLLDVHFPSFRTYTLEEIAGGGTINYIEEDGFMVPEIELDTIENNDVQSSKSLLKATDTDLFFELAF